MKENWTEKHRNVARKIFLEGGWTQKRLFGVGWSDVSQCQACQIEEGAEKHRLHHCPEWYEFRREILEAFRKLGAKSKNLKEGVEVAKRYCHAPSERKPMKQGPLQYDKVGVREAQNLEYSAETVQRPCRLSSGHGRKVESMWLGGGAVGL